MVRLPFVLNITHPMGEPLSVANDVHSMLITCADHSTFEELSFGPTGVVAVYQALLPRL
jgi:hypothetical protein